MSDTLKAPWTKLQVRRLHLRQLDSMMHGYTCKFSAHGLLIPTESGWVCQHCDYTQDWCHESDANYPHSAVGLTTMERFMMSHNQGELVRSARRITHAIENPLANEIASDIKILLERLATYEPHLKDIFNWKKWPEQTE